LRFINCARNKEQNLISFQYQGNIYCYTIKDILPGTELLVWYGEQYVKLLGLTEDHMFGKGHTPIAMITSNIQMMTFSVLLADKKKFTLHTSAGTNMSICHSRRT